MIECTEMKRKIYLSEAWMCSELGYQRLMLDKKGLKYLYIQRATIAAMTVGLVLVLEIYLILLIKSLILEE